MQSATSVDLAISFNDQGARFLAQARYSDAISHFQQALNHIKEELSATQDAHPTSRSVCSLLFFFGYVAQEKVTPPEHTENSFFVFQRPMMVTRGASANSIDAFAPLVKFSFGLLYNLAVAMHLSALATTKAETKERRLKKSLLFYELAYSMMQDESIRGVTETVAILNNIGQIHGVMGNKDKAHQCSEKLFSILVFVTDCEEKHTVQDFDVFFQSVLPALLPHAPVAEAA